MPETALRTIDQARADLGFPPDRRLRIEWPAADVRGLAVTLCRLTDADSGEPLVSVTRMVVDADCSSQLGVVAELEMLVDEGGRWFRSKQPVVVDESGEVRRAWFRWLVVEMAVAGS